MKKKGKKKYKGQHNHRQHNYKREVSQGLDKDIWKSIQNWDILDGALKELKPRKRPSVKVEVSDLPVYQKPLWSEEWPQSLKKDHKTP